MSIKALLEKYYHVFSPSEEANNKLKPEDRPKFDSHEIRNIMISYFLPTTKVFENGFAEYVQALDKEYQELLVNTYEKVLAEYKPTSSFGVLNMLSNDNQIRIADDVVRAFIDALPDEEVVKFLETQGDTKVEELKD